MSSVPRSRASLGRPLPWEPFRSYVEIHAEHKLATALPDFRSMAPRIEYFTYNSTPFKF